MVGIVTQGVACFDLACAFQYGCDRASRALQSTATVGLHGMNKKNSNPRLAPGIKKNTHVALRCVRQT